MSNRLKMAIAHAIYQLHSLHWSQRRIARELGINRETVRRHLSCRLDGSNPAISPTGSGSPKPATFSGLPGSEPSGTDYADDGQNVGAPNPAISPAGSEAVGGESKPAIPPTGSEGHSEASRRRKNASPKNDTACES